MTLSAHSFSRGRAALAAALIVGGAGLSGCGLFHDHRPAWAKARIRPVALPAAAPGARSDDGLYADAVSAITGRDYASALDVLQAARARDQNDPRVWNAFGVVYDKLGRFDLSGRYYAKAAALDPGSPIVANNRAYSRLIQTHGAPADAAATVFAQAETSPDTFVGQAALKTDHAASTSHSRALASAAISPGQGQVKPQHVNLVSKVAALLRRLPASEPDWMARRAFASAGDARIDLGQGPNPPPAVRFSAFSSTRVRPTIVASANSSPAKTGTP